MKNFRRFFAIAVVSVLSIFAIFHTQRAFSLSDARMYMFAENNILFYDPDGDGKGNGCAPRSSCNMNEVTMEDLDATSMNAKERVKMLARVYGPLSMDLQREYGIPWEVAYGMMIMESNAGADKKSVANSAYTKHGGYNFIGMRYPGARDVASFEQYINKYEGPTGDWLYFDSISQMITGYTVLYLRNGVGAYVEAIKSLEGSNYDLETYTKLLLKAYCPPSECANHDYYWGVVKGGIDAVREVAAEEGWPTSEELFKQENIPPGGNFGRVSENIRAEAYEKYGACGLPGNTPSTAVSPSNGGASGGGSSSLHASTGDGWLSNLEGFSKDPIPSGTKCDGCKEYKTSSGTPQFIVLHYTAGSNYSGVGMYNQGGTNVAPHFSIDTKQRKVYQHIPITQTSGAVKNSTYDAMSVQIEIVGVGYSDWAGADPNHPTNLKNFTEDEWAYVADLLIAINQETGIPLQSSVTWGREWEATGSKTVMPESEVKNYVGVLGHMQIQENKSDPGDIWGDVSAALNKKGYAGGISGSCVNSSGVPASFIEAVLAYAWPEYHAYPFTEMMPDWKQLVDDSNAGKNNYYVGGDGIDCNGFVSTLIVSSGLDPQYNTKDNGRDTDKQLIYLKSPESGWEMIKDINVPTDTSMLKPGDVALKKGHTFIYVGHIEGFSSVWASSSNQPKSRAPMASSPGESADGFYIFRKK